MHEPPFQISTYKEGFNRRQNEIRYVPCSFLISRLIPVPRIPFINRVVNYIYVERKHGFQVRNYISFKIEEENVARSLINPHNYLSGCSESNFVFFTPILFSRIRQIQSRRNFSSLFIHSVCFDRCLYFVFVSFD